MESLIHSGDNGQPQIAAGAQVYDAFITRFAVLLEDRLRAYDGKTYCTVVMWNLSEWTGRNHGVCDFREVCALHSR
jgi:hypothetical protein